MGAGWSYVYWLFTLMIAWLTRSCTRCHYPASGESICCIIADLGKHQNSKLEVWFLLNEYCFCTTIKSKNRKLNYHKSGNFCITQWPHSSGKITSYHGHHSSEPQSKQLVGLSLIFYLRYRRHILSSLCRPLESPFPKLKLKVQTLLDLLLRVEVG